MPAMKLLTDLAKSDEMNGRGIPPNYVRPISDRPNHGEVCNSDAPIPLIDLQGLYGQRHNDIVKQIGLACQKDGFFQVKNHGISSKTISDILRLAREFFSLPESERLKSYSNDPTKTTGLSTSFNLKTEKVSNWRDFLRLHCYPLEDYVGEWPTNPPSFRDEVAEYCTRVRGLVLTLLEAISESPRLEKDYVSNQLGQHGQHMAMNYYPPCPQPDLTYGLPGHTDPNLITLLLQDDVAGLQVSRDGKWVPVDPIPDTFIVNIGDQMAVISNGKYKSVLHRARTSIVKGLRKKLHDSMESFNSLRQQIAGEYKETVQQRYFTVTGEKADESTIENLISTGESENFLQKAIQVLDNGDPGEAGVKEIERSLAELHQVFLDMAVLVEAQGEHINDIESQVNRASSFVRGGTEQLTVARKTQKNTRKWSCYAIILLLVIIFIVILSLKPWNWGGDNNSRLLDFE